MKPSGKIVTLVRHARTVTVPEVEASAWRLSDSADEECRRLAAELRRLEPDRILTSDHQKAIATGSLLSQHLALPCAIVEGLEEHDRTGVPYFDDHSDFLAIVKRLFESPDEVVLGEETANEALERYESAVRREVDHHPDERLLLVGHATVMALLIARHNEVDAFEFWQTIEMPEALVLELPGLRLIERLSAGGASNRDVSRC